MFVKQYVAILPNGKEVQFDFRPTDREKSPTSTSRELFLIVADAGYTTHRNESKPIVVKIKTVSVKDLKIVYGPERLLQVMPPLQRMTEEEFIEEQETLLKDIPEEFQPFLRTQAWDEGHSAGYEEVINILQALSYAIKKPIEDYTKRLVKSRLTR